MLRFSLRGKIILSMGLLSAVSVLLAEAIIVWILINNQKQSIEQQLSATATTLMSMGISDYYGLKGFQELDYFIKKSLKLETVNKVINVFTKKGKLMFSSHPISEENFSEIFAPADKPMFTFYKSEKRKYRILITPYRAKTGKEYYLQLAMPTPLFKEVLRDTVGEGLLLFLFLTLLTFIVSYYLSEKLTRPVREIADHLKGLNPEQLEQWQPFSLSSTGEYLSDIAKGVNDLVIRVKSSLYNLSKTNRYLAHELRNPLTVLMGEAETVLDKDQTSQEEYREVLKSSLEEIERINNVIATVNRIARTREAQYNPKPLNLTQWLDEKIPEWNKSLNRVLRWICPKEEIISLVDENLLFRLLDNLIRNIRDHTPPDSQASLIISREETHILIVVEDSGPGLPQALLNGLNKGHLLETCQGIGLGLCLEISSICGFNLFFENKPSNGLRVSLSLA